ncbi:hypothetical protein [Pseudomonas oryzae]|uniref:hypothetical protein n=1 Tax=Pseudomonas oryzae TaxID=1392877 RepID=UPI0012FD197C|nr:hypothetical protein [Pseudomonas oryzae]
MTIAPAGPAGEACVVEEGGFRQGINPTLRQKTGCRFYVLLPDSLVFCDAIMQKNVTEVTSAID